MKKVLNIILSVILCLSVVSPCFAIQSFAETGDETTLKFKDGKFRILVFADPQDDLNPCEETLDLMYASIEAAKPDLVVFTGDNIHGPSPVLYRSKKRVEKAIRQIMEPVTSQNIPFAIVYGNHDDEGKVSKQFQMEVYNSMPGCLASEGEAMTGCGNYNLPIKSSDGAKNVFNLWFIDSGTYDKENGGYAHVAEDQLAWYKKTSDALKAENGGEPMPSLLFQHIPVPEIYKLLKEVPKGTDGAVKKDGKYYVLNTDIASGHLDEGPCPAEVNGGEFDAWKQQGDIKAAFFGHDHNNDFCGTYNGIDMVHTSGVGFYIYGNGPLHGSRVIDIDENTLDYSTYMMYYNDLVGYKSSNKARYYEGQYVHNIKVAAFSAGAVIIALTAGLITCGVKKSKAKKALKNNQK